MGNARDRKRHRKIETLKYGISMWVKSWCRSDSSRRTWWHSMEKIKMKMEIEIKSKLMYTMCCIAVPQKMPQQIMNQGNGECVCVCINESANGHSIICLCMTIWEYLYERSMQLHISILLLHLLPFLPSFLPHPMTCGIKFNCQIHFSDNLRFVSLYCLYAEFYCLRWND